MSAPSRAGVVGIVMKGYPRLSETFVLRELVLLESLGLSLHVFALRDPRERIVHPEVGRLRAPVTYLPDDFRRALPSVVAANLRLWRRDPRLYAGALGHAWNEARRHRDLAPLKRFLQAGVLVERELRGSGVVHLHAHFAHDPTTVAFYGAWLSGLRYSFSAHAKDIFAQDADTLREKLARAEFAVTCTDHNHAHLERLGGAAARVFRCHHGLRLADFTFARHPRRDGPARLLSVGRLVPKKGFPVLLRALARVRERGVEFRCDIVGEGPLDAELASEIERLGLGGFVALRGAMTQRELIEEFRSADVFVLASQIEPDGDRDGIPNVVVEAMALGVPVVSTRVSGIPECLEDGVSGVLVPPRDPESLAAALQSLLADPERADRLGRGGRERVERLFDSERNVQPIRDALEHAVHGETREVRRAVGA